MPLTVKILESVQQHGDGLDPFVVIGKITIPSGTSIRIEMIFARREDDFPFPVFQGGILHQVPADGLVAAVRKIRDRNAHEPASIARNS